MLVGYSKIGYLILPPACIRGPALICPYRPRPWLLSEARPLIESRSLFEDLRYLIVLSVSLLSLLACLCSFFLCSLNILLFFQGYKMDDLLTSYIKTSKDHFTHTH